MYLFKFQAIEISLYFVKNKQFIYDFITIIIFKKNNVAQIYISVKQFCETQIVQCEILFFSSTAEERICLINNALLYSLCLVGQLRYRQITLHFH